MNDVRVKTARDLTDGSVHHYVILNGTARILVDSWRQMVELAEKLAEAIQEEAPETTIWMDGYHWTPRRPRLRRHRGQWGYAHGRA